MTEKIEQFKNIIRDFAKIPKNSSEPTWLEICRYPYNRFEEICSRILAFYFNPEAEHKMKGLWLESLLSAIKKTEWYDYRHSIKVNTEEYAEGKRIDITIVSVDYVIAIENKISAALYNPLGAYREHIKKAYPEKKHMLLVLSLDPILDTKPLMEYNFQRCSYKTLFNEVNSRIGNYMAEASQKYLTFMIDFMKTIDNMNNTNTQIEHNFFTENRENIEELITRYEQYKANILNVQIEHIAFLKEKMSNLTKGAWWVWHGWDLGVTFNEKSHKIGIEAHYEEIEGDPLARFHACITTWKKEDWTPYRETILADFAEYNPGIHENNTGENWNRVYVRIYNGKGDTDSIIEVLEKIYNKLNAITDKIK